MAKIPKYNIVRKNDIVHEAVMIINPIIIKNNTIF